MSFPFIKPIEEIGDFAADAVDDAGMEIIHAIKDTIEHQADVFLDKALKQAASNQAKKEIPISFTDEEVQNYFDTWNIERFNIWASAGTNTLRLDGQQAKVAECFNIARNKYMELRKEFDNPVNFLTTNITDIANIIDNVKHKFNIGLLTDFFIALRNMDVGTYVENTEPKDNTIDQLVDLIRDVHSLWTTTTGKLGELLPQEVKDYIAKPGIMGEGMISLAENGAKLVANKTPSEIKSYIKIDLQPYINEVKNLTGEINSLNEDNLKTRWNEFAPFFLYLTDMVNMIVDKVAAMVPVTVSMGASMGLVVEGQANVTAINLGTTIFSGALGTLLESVNKTINMLDTYVERFAKDPAAS